MSEVEQTKGQTLYQHGVSVYDHLDKLIDHLKKGIELPDWKLPDWLYRYKEEILANLHPWYVLYEYTIFHDCGKCFCRVVDLDGKVRFPDHANVSKQTFLSAGGEEKIANLIGWDMCLHTESASEIAMRCQMWSPSDAVTLILAALAEIHSNAKMFGGIESISFKTKFKAIDRRSKQTLKHFFGEK